ncbi:hypothetical protein [Microlunatus soli]|uniref:Cellulose synthase n=1 Tax=Microlunatus soli TaxID=630515 RepID=A0A1H1XWL0_9ACTN|nr:hypothetical protein [Microlunatus soli]SDT13515.1 hypothetical protein SAMN04489812_4274 [Microlunatus soli]
MPQADAVLLPICVAIALIGVILAGLAWRRGRKGRVLQAAALVIIPFGLYLTGFLRVLWDAVVDIVRWAFRLVISPSLWIGVSLIGLCVVLFVIGLLVNRFGADPKPKEKPVKGGAAGAKPAVGAPKAAGAAKSGKQQPESDPEMDEIEALLKSRGIE